MAARDTVRYPRQDGGRSSPTVTAEEYLEAFTAAGVDRAVLVQPRGVYGHDCRYTVDSAAAAPERFRAVMSVPPGADTLDPSAKTDVVVGVRVFVHQEGDWLIGDRLDRVLAAAGRAGLVVVIVARAPQLAAVARSAARYPDVPVVLDHCARPALDRYGLVAPDEPLLSLSGHGNIALKVSTVVLAAAEALGDPAGLVDQLAARFGRERLLWGSNFPASTGVDPAGALALAQRAATGLDDAGRARFLAGTAARLWRF